MAWLVQRTGPLAGARCEISPLATIGRDPASTIVLDHAEASRRHAEVRYEDSRYLLVDLGSKNGTFRNGVRVTEPVDLSPGDEIAVPGLVLLFGTDDTVTSRAPRAPLPPAR